MKVYKINADKSLKRLNEQKIRLEKDVQQIIEKNLGNIFKLELIKSEFTIKNRRIDTLAYDPEINSFIIIEYKRDKNKSVVDQGYAYLRLLIEYKAEFVLIYNEVKGESKNKEDIDWSQSKILFLTNKFLDYSIEAYGREMSFELWEISIFDDDLLTLTKVEPKYSATLYELTPPHKINDKTSSEIQVYDEIYHLRNKPTLLKELYDTLKEQILDIDENIEVRVVKSYIGFMINNTYFVIFTFTKSQIHIHLCLNRLKESYNDPEDILKDIPESHVWGERCRFSIDSMETIPYAIHLIKQSYKA